ncbi:hypothetical protein BFP70_06085 [Thioclava sp. SK-1]|uniref:hypothetical protein n=1 Tax=Thioclava sp. SK-1 TaxID=1889770 RepID=UPI000826823D|nr:hypothetical protein [Thioclava sp. SK-1]OCX66268.1 hypothetical protein BFP70_06085 [Thioclava sp. SK-1]
MAPHLVFFWATLDNPGAISRKKAELKTPVVKISADEVQALIDGCYSAADDVPETVRGYMVQ